MKESCETCGAPMVKVIKRKRRPSEMCVNMDCPANQNNRNNNNNNNYNNRNSGKDVEPEKKDEPWQKDDDSGNKE